MEGRPTPTPTPPHTVLSLLGRAGSSRCFGFTFPSVAHSPASLGTALGPIFPVSGTWIIALAHLTRRREDSLRSEIRLSRSLLMGETADARGGPGVAGLWPGTRCPGDAVAVLGALQPPPVGRALWPLVPAWAPRTRRSPSGLSLKGRSRRSCRFSASPGELPPARPPLNPFHSPSSQTGSRGMLGADTPVRRAKLVNSLNEARVLACSGCCNQTPWTEWLKQQTSWLGVRRPGRPGPRRGLIRPPGAAGCLACGRPPPGCVCTRHSGSSASLLAKALVPSSDCLPKPHLQAPANRELGLQRTPSGAPIQPVTAWAFLVLARLVGNGTQNGSRFVSEWLPSPRDFGGAVCAPVSPPNPCLSRVARGIPNSPQSRFLCLNVYLLFICRSVFVPDPSVRPLRSRRAGEWQTLWQGRMQCFGVQSGGAESSMEGGVMGKKIKNIPGDERQTWTLRFCDSSAVKGRT